MLIQGDAYCIYQFKFTNKRLGEGVTTLCGQEMKDYFLHLR
jgi:hypothetical protein